MLLLLFVIVVAVAVAVAVASSHAIASAGISNLYFARPGAHFEIPVLNRKPTLFACTSTLFIERASRSFVKQVPAPSFLCDVIGRKPLPPKIRINDVVTYVAFLCDVIEDSAPPSLHAVILVVRWGRIFDDVIEESAPL